MSSGTYDFHDIEKKWQDHWVGKKTFKTTLDTSKPKYYVLDMFPYPSGSGLHVGHPEGYTATDIMARYKRMKGFNVLHPMGWDAFGLPAERHAVRTGEHPAIITNKNCDTFRQQIQALGLSYDWDREINTTDPDYYKWTQWIFTVLLERGLAYEIEAPVNWCPALNTVLANEEVKDGVYVETGDPVEKRMMRQWMLRITKYAEQLLSGLDDLDWPEGIKAMQREWIGRSEGADVTFKVADAVHEFTVFTTRPDTLYGATYCVLAPDHALTLAIASDEQRAAVQAYVDATKKKSAQERMRDEQQKTGVFTGAHAINPVNGALVPIWTADYVLAEYGYGAIMAVPAHDTRDHEFATKFGIDIIEVIGGGAKSVQEEAWTGDGVLVNSGFLDGLNVSDAKKKMAAWLEAEGIGKGTVNYKLRDWLFSRQRYWGEPFPIVRTADGTVKPLPMSDLPVLLPELTDYKPTSDGQPPLARATEWLNTTDPETGAPAQRETNTMPQWAGSCWYYLRFCDPRNPSEAWSKEAEQYWMPVDLYIGGAEHAVLHLLYSRFWHKVLYDAGHVSTSEPFQKLFNQGMILAYSYRNNRGQYFYPKDTKSIAVKSRKSGIEDKETKVIAIESQSEINTNIVFNSAESFGPVFQEGQPLECAYEVNEHGFTVPNWYHKEPRQRTTVSPFLVYWTRQASDEIVDREARQNEGVVTYSSHTVGPVIFQAQNGEYYDWTYLDGLSGCMSANNLTIANEKITGIFEVITQINVEKMSKSRYNVVNPDDVIKEYGADSMRLYEMFMGPLDREKPWNDEGVQGVFRFLKRVWSLYIAEDGGLHPRVVESGGSAEVTKQLHKTIKAVGHDIEHLLFNTAISRMMEFVNAALKAESVDRAALEKFALVLAPFAPHLAEELWQRLGHADTLAYEPWPAYDEALLVESTLEVPVQVNGKLRAKIVIAADASQADVLAAAKADESVAKYLAEGALVKEIYVPGKMVNLVVK
jgi:leucyl-tRNA synthetase family protein